MAGSQMTAAKRKAGEVDALIGRNVRYIREKFGATQDDLAQALRESGWQQASGLTVFTLERGERAVSVEETFLLGDVFNVPVTEFFVGERDEFVQIGTLYRENTKALRKRLTEAPRKREPEPWGETQRHRKVVQIDTGGYVENVAAREAEGYAAKKLGVSPDEIVRRSLALWHRTLTEERDARTAERIAPDAPASSRRVLRGHVGRELLAELEHETEVAQ
jgi:transcriptional regulator with XRE-family HTH domain